MSYPLQHKEKQTWLRKRVCKTRWWERSLFQSLLSCTLDVASDEHTHGGAVGSGGCGQTESGQDGKAETSLGGRLTGPRRSMSSRLICDTRASLATRARCRRSLNSISSPCISATWNTQAPNRQPQGQTLPTDLPRLLWAHAWHLSAKPWEVVGAGGVSNTTHVGAMQTHLKLTTFLPELTLI